MKISHRGIIALEGREGIQLTVYRDSVGIPTVGVGHVVLPEDNLKVGQKITQERCDEFLAKDIRRFEKCVERAINVYISQNEIDALISFAFNIGEGGFAKSSVVKRLNAGDRAGAAKAFMNWVTPKEITGRRRTEIKQFLTPYPAASSSIPATNKEGSAPDEPPTNSASNPAERPLLKFGVRSFDVITARQMLGMAAGGDGSAFFDEYIEQKVEDFQREYSKTHTPGLAVDGVVGPATWAALEAANNVSSVKDSLTDGDMFAEDKHAQDVVQEANAAHLDKLQIDVNSLEGSMGKDTPPEPVEVKAETPSTFTKIGVAITGFFSMLATYGINAGSVIQGKLEQITLNQVLITALFLAIGAIAILWYDRSSKRAQERTMKKIKQ